MLHNVSEDIFNRFLKNKNFTKRQGSNFHSEEFLNSEGEIKAYVESSSWGAETVYQIDDDSYENFETFVILNQLFK